MRAWLFALLAWAVLAIHGFASPRPPDGAWGAVGMMALRPSLRAVLLLLAATLAMPPVARWVVRTAGPLARAARDATRGVPTWAWIALLVAVGWLLRSQVFYGDGLQTAHQLERGELINTKEPLDRLLTALTYRAGHALVGLDAATAIALVSTLAGVLFWSGVARLARRRPIPGLGGGSVWVLLGTIGTVEVFFGHVENYALLTGGTLWALVCALEAAQDRRRSLYPAAAVMGLTLATHLSAAWLVGVLPVTWWWRHREAVSAGGRRREPLMEAAREAAGGAALAFLPIAVVAAGMAVSGAGVGGFSLPVFGGGDGRLFVPLAAVETPYERFTMFSAAHLAAFGNELLLVAPVGVLLALVGSLGRRQDGRRTDGGTWVLLAAALGTLSYAFLFNPDMMVANPVFGPFNEWDLFAFLGVPVTLLGLWWLRTAMEPGEERSALVLSAAVLSLVHCVPWLLFNAGVRL